MENTPSWTEGDLHTVFQAAHHDLWWAKGQLWTAANWTLVLLTAVVGVGRLLYPDTQAGLSTTWPVVLFLVLIAFAAAWYLPRLHGDIVRARSLIAFVRREKKGLDDLLNATPNTREPSPDRTRGVPFVIGLVAVVAAAFGMALIVVTRSQILGAIAVIAHLAVGSLILYRNVRRGAA